MSEVVVRMEMPTSCQECRFSVDGWCYALRAEDEQPSKLCYLTRPEWCPLCDAAPRWVRCEEPPKKGYQRAMVYSSETGNMVSGTWTEYYGWLIPGPIGKITHWMPIEPPREDT